MEENAVKNAKLVYILYLVGVVVGVTSIIGVIMAYVNRGDAPEWLKTHYSFQIRTFWIAMLYSVIGLILSMVIIGFLVLLFALVWYIVRCVQGMKYLDEQKPVEKYDSWMFV